MGNDVETAIAEKRQTVKCLFAFDDEHGLDQIVILPTRNENIIGLILTNVKNSQLSTTTDSIVWDPNLVQCEVTIHNNRDEKCRTANKTSHTTNNNAFSC